MSNNDTSSATVRAESGKVVLNGSSPDGGESEIILSPENARKLTGAIRACASSIDGEEYYKGGWSNAEALRAIATDYTKLVEGDGSDL